MALLEFQKLRSDSSKLVEVVVADDSVAIAILRIAVRAEVHAAPKLERSLGDRKNLIEIRLLDHSIESDAVDSNSTHSRNDVEYFPGKTGDSASKVVPLVEVIQRDVELVDARFPQRSRALGRQHSTVREQRREFHAHGSVDSRDNLFEIGSHRRLAAGIRDHHRIEKPRGVRKTL